MLPALVAGMPSSAVRTRPARNSRYDGPPPILPACLNGTLPPPTVGPVEDGLIHVAFFDTRPHPDTGAMLDAARQIRKSGGAETVRFHVLLHAAYTRVVPGMTRTALSLPPAAQCLLSGLQRLAHGPGPAYLYKPLLHFLLPTVRQLILLDTDTVMLQPIAELWRHFGHFGSAVLGVANEQSNMYQRVSRGTEVGKNGGVQLLHLHAMRASTEYNAVRDGQTSPPAAAAAADPAPDLDPEPDPDPDPDADLTPARFSRSTRRAR